MRCCAGNYDEYFGTATDIEAVVYMMLMNQTLHDLYPTIVTVGEDVSGMPTFSRLAIPLPSQLPACSTCCVKTGELEPDPCGCGRPVAEGGVGFDYRLQMAIADKWVDVLETLSDHDWNMGNLVHTMTNRRYAEPCVAYAESHDQV